MVLLYASGHASLNQFGHQPYLYCSGSIIYIYIEREGERDRERERERERERPPRTSVFGNPQVSLRLGPLFLDPDPSSTGTALSSFPALKTLLDKGSTQTLISKHVHCCRGIFRGILSKLDSCNWLRNHGGSCRGCGQTSLSLCDSLGFLRTWAP